MPRILLAALAAVILLLPATADGNSGTRLRGFVTDEDAVRKFVTVSSARRDHVLRVAPASLARIRPGMRVELRGTTLRRHGNGSRVLSRNVVLVRSEVQADDEIDVDDDELEVKGTLVSLTPLTVVAHGHSFTCAVPDSHSLAGFAVGEFVEMTCDLRGGVFVLRELEHEDDDEIRDDDDDDNSGPGNADDDDDDDNNSGPGNGGDDDDDDDNSGPGNGDDDDDDDDDNSGPGGGDDDD